MSAPDQSNLAAQSSLVSGRIAPQLIGVWKLVSCVEQQEGREDRFPLGPKPEGFLIYTSDGFVSAQLMKPGRSPFQAHNWQQATAQEFQEAGAGYIGYCGIYQVDEENETVTHIPSVAFLPNLIKAKQLRSVELRGDRLTLRTVGSFVANGPSATSRLEWRRAGGQTI